MSKNGKHADNLNRRTRQASADQHRSVLVEPGQAKAVARTTAPEVAAWREIAPGIRLESGKSPFTSKEEEQIVEGSLKYLELDEKTGFCDIPTQKGEAPFSLYTALHHVFGSHCKRAQNANEQVWLYDKFMVSYKQYKAKVPWASQMELIIDNLRGLAEQEKHLERMEAAKQFNAADETNKTKSYPTAYGHNLDEYRNRLGFSMKQLAEEVGISERSIKDYIIKGVIPSAKYRKKLYDYFTTTHRLQLKSLDLSEISSNIDR